MKKYIYFIFSFVFLVVSLWGLMWVFSSVSLASGFCENEFDLFHESFRCRQPYIAAVLFIFSTLTSIVLLVFGVRNRKK